MNNSTYVPVTQTNRIGLDKRYRIANKPVVAKQAASHNQAKKGGVKQMVLLRNELGNVLRDNRLRQRRTLREVSAAAKVSLGYLSEVERGQKEASSELLGSICQALDLPLWVTLREVADRVATAEGAWIPDSPADLIDQSHRPLAAV